VAEWLTSRGGAEQVLDALLETYPSAQLFTTVYNPKRLPEYLKRKPITSFLQNIPVARNRHQALPPLLLRAIESLNFGDYDLIISSSSAIGKGIKKPDGAVHVCYCHTPMRYVWQSHIDRRLVQIPFGKHFINYLKKWDLKTNSGVDYFLTNSNNTKKRIKDFYNREAAVIYPPVEITPPKDRVKKQEFYLCLGRLIPYKRFDLAISACRKLNRKLIIAGIGPELKSLKKIAANNTEFVGRVNDKQKARLLSRARALIFPSDEDFGIVPVEAMGYGTGVIALGKGGALESVIDGKTGVFFKEQTEESARSAIMEFERLKLDPAFMQNHAKKFSKNRFKSEIKEFIERIKL